MAKNPPQMAVRLAAIAASEGMNVSAMAAAKTCAGHDDGADREPIGEHAERKFASAMPSTTAETVSEAMPGVTPNSARRIGSTGWVT